MKVAPVARALDAHRIRKLLVAGEKMSQATDSLAREKGLTPRERQTLDELMSAWADAALEVRETLKNAARGGSP